MKNFIGAVVVCTTIAIALLPSVSMSQQSLGQAKFDRERLHGSGGFVAKGKGQAMVKGDGKISVEGKGTVVIRASRKDDINAQGFGFKRQDGNLFYFEGRGTLHVKGTNIGVDITGDVDGLKAVGSGTARLIGSGHYKAAGDQGNWNGNGIDAAYGKR